MISFRNLITITALIIFYMGEYSKRIGQIGEDIVWDFLKRIGWTNIQTNFDIKSIDPKKHGKNTHGIDGLFSYESPMIANTIENVLISSKFSSKRYPNNPVSSFKDYYTDIASAVESFRRSSLKQDINLAFDNIESSFQRGIVFWLTNHEDDSQNLAASLLSIVPSQKFVHDGIFLVDNRRVAFIYNTLNFADSTYTNSKIDFLYFLTGLNNDDICKRNGAIFPIQYFSSSLLPLRIQNNQTNETTVLVSSIDRFDPAEILKILGVARSLGNNSQVKTVICFPDYTKSEHEQYVKQASQIMNDVTFTNGLHVTNYNDKLRG